MRQYLSQACHTLLGMSLSTTTSTLPPVPAPRMPYRGLCFGVGMWVHADPYRLVAVTGKSFTVAHHGKRERHDLSEWHTWLTQLFLSAPVHINGHPMLAPVQAPLVNGITAVAVQKEARMDWTPEQRRKRILRATQDVLKRYEIAPQEPIEGRLVFALRGGTKVWRVEVHPQGATPPTCTCPDFAYRFHKSVACKHVLAVLLSHPNLRVLALDCFL